MNDLPAAPAPAALPTKTLKDFINVVTCGDAIAEMEQLPAKSVKIVVTSPPYNLRNSTGGGMHNGSGGKWSKAKLLEGYETDETKDNYEDEMPHDKYVEWQRGGLTQMMRVLQDDGVIFYNHKWRVQGGKWQDRADIVNDLILPVRQIIIWSRSGGINFNKGYFLPSYEVIYMFAGPKFALDPKVHGMTDVWKITQDLNNPHPASFPEELVTRCIEAGGNGLVLDPFLGSGTTAIVAERLGRSWIGIDKSKKYTKMAEDRIVEARTNPRIVAPVLIKCPGCKGAGSITAERAARVVVTAKDQVLCVPCKGTGKVRKTRKKT